MPRQGCDVGTPLGKRPQVNRHDVQPVEQIVSEPTRCRLGGEILRGRREQTHVHPPRLLVSHAPDLALLQHPQQLRLERERQLPDLVQQQRTAVGLLEQSRTIARGAGERAFYVAEQLRLE